ncbi:MAG: flagellar hook-length control protein FliK [Desulfuromusa sp.]|jgi:flagellar hook-length control protein FliK|nr:flagellar hook-length control protein FliK [Desulfuromusa sp.]
MHALSMIDMGKQPVDVVAPVKTLGKDEKQFGKVLNEKQQVHQQHDSQPEPAAGSRDKQVIAHKHKTEMKQEATGQKESLDEAVIESSIQQEAVENCQIQAKLQHTLVDLMKVMVKGEPMAMAENSDSLESILIGETTEIPESFHSIEKLLTDLVQQLKSTELSGEHVLAGVDLSALTAELQSPIEDSSHEELLAQLVTAVEEQLTEESSSLENVELAAVMGVEPQQQNVVPVVMENLVQARQILQKAFDSVVSQKSVAVETVVAEENVAVVEQPAEEASFVMEEVADAIDPRFARLFKPRSEQRPVVQQTQSSREPVQLHNSKQPVGLNQSESVDQVLPAEMTTQKVETTQISGDAVKRGLENLVQQTQHNLQPQGQAQVQGLEMNKAMPPAPVVQLVSGQQMAESQIFDQVVTQISGSVNGESGRMVLRLQPAELGSLKLELMVEGDRIRANIQAQSHQVQDVLERNLPQLRNALAEQGLKIDQFQVNIDQRQQGGQFENLAQQQQHNGSEKQPGWQQQNSESEEQSIPLAHLMQNGGGGISLHV